MLTFKTSVALLLCLLHVPAISSAVFRYKKPGSNKRLSSVPSRSRVAKRGGTLNFGEDMEVYFKGNTLNEVTEVTRHSNLVLNCEAGGPSPTIHWLKNGVRIQQGGSHNVRDDQASYENHLAGQKEPRLRLATTNSKLYLDCVDDDNNAVYTCVAESPFIRITSSTRVKVVKSDYNSYSEMNGCTGKRSGKAEVARVYMWTATRLEYQNGRVQLYCRAQGVPAPSITWYDSSNNIIQDDDHFKIARNGDLVINNINWYEHMGTYTCEADNGFGTDSATAFLYPTGRD